MLFKQAQDERDSGCMEDSDEFVYPSRNCTGQSCFLGQVGFYAVIEYRRRRRVTVIRRRVEWGGGLPSLSYLNKFVMQISACCCAYPG